MMVDREVYRLSETNILPLSAQPVDVSDKNKLIIKSLLHYHDEDTDTEKYVIINESSSLNTMLIIC